MSHDHPHSHEHPHTHGDAPAHTHEHGGHHHEHTAPADLSHGAAFEQRLAARGPYSGLSEDELAASYEEQWSVRRAATESIIALTEETIARLVELHVPDAAEVVLYEDHSHDAPHAHVRHIVDASGEVLIEANGDAWHDEDWTGEIDELVWDLYHLDRHGFVSGGHGRVRHIPVKSA